MWREKITQAIANSNLGAFQRQVLSDYQITDAEYREAVQLYIQCMADFGWIVQGSGLSGGYSGEAAPGSGNENSSPSVEIEANCQAESISFIEPIYLGMKDNPEGIRWEQQVHECFLRHDVSDGVGMSDSEFAQMVLDPQYRPSTPTGLMCYFDPTGSGGLTPEGAAELGDPDITLGPGDCVPPDCMVIIPTPRW